MIKLKSVERTNHGNIVATVKAGLGWKRTEIWYRGPEQHGHPWYKSGTGERAGPVKKYFLDNFYWDWYENEGYFT